MQNKNISLEAIRVIVKEEIRPEIERLDKKITDFKDEILTGQDNMSKKLDTILNEHPSMNASIDQNRDKIKNHEERIQQVEINTAQA